MELLKRTKDYQRLVLLKTHRVESLKITRKQNETLLEKKRQLEDLVSDCVFTVFSGSHFLHR